MITRTVTGICLLALLFFALAMGGWVFSVLFMLSLCLSMYEMYRALKETGHGIVIWPNWLCLLLSIPLFNLAGSVTLLLPLVAGAAMLTSAVVLFRREPRLEDILISVMPLGCVLLPGMCMLGLQNAPAREMQLALSLLAFGVPLFGDTLAYFFGSRFGKIKLSPIVSPNKSVEGAVAGMVGSLLFAIGIWAAFSGFSSMPPLWHFLILGFLGGIAGQLGDLFASLIKRHCGIKDYGSIFPGHGGMMDRLDSVYWATVVMYIYLNLTMMYA